MWKCKKMITTDCVILGFTEGSGKFKQWFGAIELGQYKDGELVNIGQCSGLTDFDRSTMSENRKGYIGQVVEVKAAYKFKGGGLRHPQFLHLRPDKAPEDCEALP